MVSNAVDQTFYDAINNNIVEKIIKPIAGNGEAGQFPDPDLLPRIRQGRYSGQIYFLFFTYQAK